VRVKTGWWKRNTPTLISEVVYANNFEKENNNNDNRLPLGGKIDEQTNNQINTNNECRRVEGSSLAGTIFVA
jgi:hypothetical protein